MNLEEILGIVAALFGGLNIFQFIFLRITKKEFAAKAERSMQEALGQRAENDAKAVETLKEVIDELRADKTALRADIMEKCKYIDILKEDRYTAATHICLHMGCAMRRPENGKGQKWLEQQREETDIDVDYMPVNKLLEQYGKNKEAIIERATKEV